MSNLKFTLTAQHLAKQETLVRAKSAELRVDTSLAGSPSELNPIELLLAAQAACFIKGIERIAPTLNFSFAEVLVQLEAERPEQEARIASINYVVSIRTEESDARLELMHKNLKRQGTIFNTISAGTKLEGVVRRAD